MPNTTGGIVIGMIMHWSGSIASIPTGWLLCNGSNGTPDLRDKFVLGAGNTYNPDDTGGAATHTHPFNFSINVLFAFNTAAAAGVAGGNGFPISISSNTNATANMPPYYALAYIFNPDITRGIPDDAILIWSGSSASIPAEFALCNGSNGTIDLRDKFIIGAGSTYAVGATGGTIGAHQHTWSASGSSGLSGTGTLLTTYPVGNYDSFVDWSISGATGDSPTSGKAIPPYYAYCFIQNISGGTRGIITGMIAYWSGTEASIPAGFELATELQDKFIIGVGNTYAVGATGGATTHNHLLVSGGGSGTLGGGSNKYVAGTAVNIQGSSGGTGSITAVNSMPPYYALCYIKKS